jgi:hypothetical protein
MSTLLKKKYCQERSGTSTNNVCVNRDDESNETGLSTSEQESDVAISSTAVPIPVSPVSVTVSSDDVTSHSSIVPSDETECTDFTSIMSCKSVRFSDVHQILIDNDYSEKVHEFRTDIWYSVRCLDRHDFSAGCI